MCRVADHFFVPADGEFHPTPSALSRWGTDTLNGPAVVGLAARCLENEYHAAGFLPARFTADLCRAARRVPTSVRLRLARATTTSYRRSGPPPGAEWQGEPASPFVRAVVAAEATSLVTNLGTRGIGYINGDLTVAIARLPVSDYVGVQADSYWCDDGIAVGAATLFDDSGPFGIGMVTAVANPAAQIDFGTPS